MMAGGASFAPSLWSFPADATEMRILVHRLDDCGEEEEELGVLAGGLTRIKQVLAGVGGNGPVVVLAASVHAVKGLLVEQADHAMLARGLAHQLHHQLVVIACDVRRGENRGELVLGGGNLVVLGLGEDAKLPQFLVQVFHEGLDAGLYHAEVVVLKLLPLGGLRAEEGPAGENQILALVVDGLVHKEVFLLGADRRLDAGDIGVAEELQDAESLPVYRLHGAEEGGLLVQGLASVGAESRRDAEGPVLDKGE